jgi:hypothetical protein
VDEVVTVVAVVVVVVVVADVVDVLDELFVALLFAFALFDEAVINDSISDAERGCKNESTATNCQSNAQTRVANH